MIDSAFRLQRRAWLLTLAASGIFGAAGLPGLIRRAHAAATRPFPDGVQEIKGEVSVNNAPTKLGALISPGDVVSTGANGQVVFVIGQDAYFLRANSRVQVSGDAASKSASGDVKAAVVRALNLLSGKMLATFGKGEKKISTPTVTIGIRGTAIYVEAEPMRSYVCTCYGEVVLEAKESSATETIRAKHHDAPRYIYGAGVPQSIVNAPVINHSDAELNMLETLLGRSPPFAGDGYSRSY